MTQSRKDAAYLCVFGFCLAVVAALVAPAGWGLTVFLVLSLLVKLTSEFVA